MGAFRRLLCRRREICCSGVFLIAGCTLDERVLHQGSGTDDSVSGLGGDGSLVIGQAGSGTGGTGAAQGGAAATGAIGGSPDTTPPGTTSWTFDTDAAAFEPEAYAMQAWSPEDAEQSSSSGSLLLTNDTGGTSADFSSVGTTACVAVEPHKSFDVSMQIYIAPGQVAGSGGYAVQFFDAADCNGTLVGLANFVTATAGSWRLGERPCSPLNAKSAQIRLVASKILDDPSFSVLFDDVVLQAL